MACSPCSIEKRRDPPGVGGGASSVCAGEGWDGLAILEEALRPSFRSCETCVRAGSGWGRDVIAETSCPQFTAPRAPRVVPMPVTKLGRQAPPAELWREDGQLDGSLSWTDGRTVWSGSRQVASTLRLLLSGPVGRRACDVSRRTPAQAVAESKRDDVASCRGSRKAGQKDRTRGRRTAEPCLDDGSPTPCQHGTTAGGPGPGGCFSSSLGGARRTGHHRSTGRCPPVAATGAPVPGGQRKQIVCGLPTVVPPRPSTQSPAAGFTTWPRCGHDGSPCKRPAQS